VRLRRTPWPHREDKYPGVIRDRISRMFSLFLLPFSAEGRRMPVRQLLHKIDSLVVILPQGLGDLVMARPALKALFAATPSAHKAIVVQARVADFARLLYPESSVIPLIFARLGKHILRFLRDLLALRHWRPIVGRHTLAVVPYPDLRNNIITLVLGARTRLGFSISGSGFLLTHCLPSRTGLVRRGEWMCDISRAFGVEPLWIRVSLDESVENDLRRRLPLPRKFVVIHPGAREPLRRLPMDALRTVCRRLRGAGLRVIVIVPPDYPEAESIDVASRIRTKQAEELIYILSSAAVAVCMDSGAMHLAHATGTPTVGIFTQNTPQRVAPVGPTPFVAVEPTTQVRCRPCSKKICSSERECVRSVYPEQIVAAVRNLISEVGGI